MDFLRIGVREIEKGPNKGEFEVYPDFVIGRSQDLMIRGRTFYAVWDEEAGVWSTDEYDVQRLVDQKLRAYADDQARKTGAQYHVRYLQSAENQGWYRFRKYIQNISDHSYPLDDSLTFANTQVKKSDYVSRRLSYALAEGDYSAWDELIGTLYSVEERQKIEWAIGAIVSGDSKKIQKFLVFYGPAGTGKSTMLNIIQKLFDGYVTTFDAKSLGSTNGSFATEAFRSNPLVAIQHDGDLSKIEDNTRLNSIISHEEMMMNEKYKASYTARVNAFLLMGTNQPVKISDAKSGIIRRLIDVHPTGVKISPNHYQALMSKIDFELGAIAYHCLEVYRYLGKNHFNQYRPTEMMLQTDVFFNFIEAHYDIFKAQNGVSLKQAYSLYKEFCSETGIDRVLPMYKVREELRNYFDDFHDKFEVEGQMVRSFYSGFNANKFKTQVKTPDVYSLVLEETVSLLDEELKDMPAQLSKQTNDGRDIPRDKWVNVKTTLADINTTELHYVKVPENHVVIDFDLTDDLGEKSLELNMEAASSWPATYAELSKGGSGVHLHYIFDGDVSELSNVFSKGIEVKTLLGDSSLRRRLSKCNNVPIATLAQGVLPVKEKKVISADAVKSERGLRDLIQRNFNKEFHPGTKPSLDFIKKILDDAYESGMVYDVSDLRGKLLIFANNSTNQYETCLKIVQSLKLKSEQATAEVTAVETEDERLVFFDVEVYPNLFVVCWKYEGSDHVTRMINPSGPDMEGLFKYKLVGFNCRRYDNHILWGRYMGLDNQKLYELSQRIISGAPHALYGEAYNVSFTDIYDYASIKQSLKKWEIDLGIHHMEMDIPWDQPVPDELINKVVEYCVNDVNATEQVHKDRLGDFIARQILSELSGLSMNHTTQQHAAKIIFNGDRNPQASFQYPDLSKEFPGYQFELGKSHYKGEIVGEGGYVYAEPGMYENVVLLDVASMHPTSIINMNLFGDEFTKRFKDLYDAQLHIKRGEFDAAGAMFGGKMAQFITNREAAKSLRYALKIVINIVYGLTSAKFDNPFRDIRNRDNVVAKRGSLFMVDLKEFIQSRGFTVAHIKTDSVKIPNATPEIIEEVMRFGEKYGYTFEHEATYDKLVLVNDAVYVARKGDEYTAVGAQFQVPYVYKTLFSKEPIGFKDFTVAKSVTKGAMYLDYEHDRPAALAESMQFVGRTGLFVPVNGDMIPGGVLWRIFEDKRYAVAGTKGYLWMEAEKAEAEGVNPQLDDTYFLKLVDDAISTINKFGSFDEFVS